MKVLWKNNLKCVKDVSMIYVNFIVFVIPFCEEKIGGINFLPPLLCVCTFRQNNTWSDNKVRELATVSLPWQHWTKALVWFDDINISAFHSCVFVDLWQSLSEWHQLLSEYVVVTIQADSSCNVAGVYPRNLNHGWHRD